MRDTERGSNDRSTNGTNPGETNADRPTANRASADRANPNRTDPGETGRRSALRTAEGGPNGLVEVLRDAGPEATIDRPERPGYEEVYVVPEPDRESARYRVFVLTAAGRVHGVGAFDLDELERSESGFPPATDAASGNAVPTDTLPSGAVPIDTVPDAASPSDGDAGE